MAAEYRADEIGPDDQIIRRVDLICANDAVAKERAQQLVDRNPIELWRGERFLARFDPPSFH